MAKKRVDSGAFKNQSAITSIQFGSDCYSVGESAFCGCISLSKINDNNLIEIIESNAFDGDITLKSANFNMLSRLHNCAFRNCVKLSHIGIPICTDIPDEAFANCTTLNGINISTISTVGSSAFLSCKNLKNINLQSCTRIGNDAFKGCGNIKEITLNSCSLIGAYAFADCSKLSKVYINAYSCKLNGKYVFCNHDNESDDTNHNISFYFDASIYHNYINDSNWSHYINNMIMTSYDNQITYSTNDNKIIYIKKHELNELNNPIVSHIYYDNKYGLIDFRDKYTKIEDNTFEDCENLIDINLPNKLDEIGYYAFKNCKSFTSFNIPNNIETLGEGIFAGCENIKKFEGKFTSYDGKVVIYKTTLICVAPKDDSDTEGRIYNINDFGPTVKRLGNSCFHGCVNMRRVDIPDTVTDIGSNAFEGCNNLCEVHFEGNEPPTLGSDVFKDVREDFKIFVPETALEEYVNKWKLENIYPKSDESIIYYSNNLAIMGNSTTTTVNLNCFNGKYNRVDLNAVTFISKDIIPSNATKVIVGDNFKVVGLESFANCKDLEYIYLSDNITSLQNNAFRNCSKLTRVHISSKCIYFGEDVFYGCTNLKEFGTYYKNFVTDDNRCYIYDKTLTFFAQGGLSDKDKEYSIPDDITKIHSSAFGGSDIEKIKLSNNTTIIGERAFADCGHLKSIENWNSVETISTSAFEGCIELAGISLPSKLETISTRAFADCQKMYIINNIPDTVKTIESYAFENCVNFKYFNETENEQNPLNLNIEEISDYVFFNCSQLKEVNICEKITSIGQSAFEGCELLSSVNFTTSGTTLTTINNNAFKNCKELMTLDIPENIQTIGDCAFLNCEKYKGFNDHIYNSVSSIGKSCFKNSGVEKLNILEDSQITEIPESAFEDCKNLSSINIDNSQIRKIGAYSFKGCEQLSDITSLSQINSIGDYAFENCNQLENIRLDNIDELGDHSLSTNGITNIYMRKTNPPIFTKNDIEDLKSLPFGNVIDTNIKIFVHFNNINTYKNDKHWIKYKDIIYSEEPVFEITINLGSAYLDGELLNNNFKISDIGTADMSRGICLYNSLWQIDSVGFWGYEFNTSGTANRAVKFKIKRESGIGVLEKDISRANTLNVSIPMVTNDSNKLKFRILVPIEADMLKILENEQINDYVYTPRMCMLSMNCAYDGYGNDNDSAISFGGDTNIKLMKYRTHYSDADSSYYPITTPTTVSQEVCPSILYPIYTDLNDFPIKFIEFDKYNIIQDTTLSDSWSQEIKINDKFSLLGYYADRGYSFTTILKEMQMNDTKKSFRFYIR